MTTSTPTPEALRHRAAARRWALSLMVLFTVASMAFNVVIAARHGGAIEDLVLAGLAPAVLASMGHLLAKFVQAAIEASGVTSYVYWAGVAGVSVIGLGAFILSFENLQTLAARQHNWFVAGVFPVMLDLAILVSTGIHVVIGIANENDQAAGVEPYRGWLARRFGWGTAAPAVLQPVPAELPVRELVTTAPMSTPQPVTVTPVTDQLTAPGAQLTTAADEVITAPIPAAQQREQQGEQRPVTSGDAVTGQPAAHRDAQVNGAGEQEVVTNAQLPAGDQEPAAPLPTAGGEQPIDPERDAQVLRERGARLPEDQLADVIARIAAGESFSSISEATGISRNTVRKVAGQLPTQAEPEPAIA